VTLPQRIAEPSAEAEAVVRDLLFDDAFDYATTVGACAVRVSAACEARELGRAQQHFALLRLAAIALFSDLEKLSGQP
jgi:hypothetical protein